MPDAFILRPPAAKEFILECKLKRNMGRVENNTFSDAKNHKVGSESNCVPINFNVLM
jgi:hypothetical protein